MAPCQSCVLALWYTCTRYCGQYRRPSEGLWCVGLGSEIVVFVDDDAVDFT